MELIERSRDIVTGSTDLEELHSLPAFPVFMGCADHPSSKDLISDMTWCISRDSGFIQLKRLIPRDILYQSQHHAGSVGAIWMEHHASFAAFLSRFAPSSVLEIGGAHGILARTYTQLSDIPWTILEPNPSPVEGCRARFIKGFFDATFSYREAFDTVVHSHVFEHIYEPDHFMHQLAEFMAEGKRLVFSLPNMQAMLERKYTNCLNFEHTGLLTEPYIELLLAKNGFRLLAKEYFMDDHSIFYATIPDHSVKPLDLPRDLYEKNKQLYMAYVRYHQDFISHLNRKLAVINKPVYLFGAHVFAQYLIAFGLDTKRVVSLLDNDPNKQGKRLYGTHLMVQSPKILRDVEHPSVILHTGIYNQEIKADILNNINASTTFLE